MRNLTLDEDQMNIDAAQFEDVRLVPDDEGNFRILPARMLKKSRVSNISSISKLLKSASQSSGSKKPAKYTPTKIPDKITSTVASNSITKNDLLNILRSKDFIEIIRRILQEKLRSYQSLDKVSELPEDHEEDDPMDINITRLENAKDLLALEGKVNRIEVQCLADTCANASFIHLYRKI
jgi:hypothetical protein